MELANRPDHQRLKNLIRKCFSLVDDHGNKMDEVLIHNNVRCYFTPEFFPRRYEFKDFLYERVRKLIEVFIKTTVANGVT